MHHCYLPTRDVQIPEPCYDLVLHLPHKLYISFFFFQLNHPVFLPHCITKTPAPRNFYSIPTCPSSAVGAFIWITASAAPASSAFVSAGFVPSAPVSAVSVSYTPVPFVPALSVSVAFTPTVYVSGLLASVLPASVSFSSASATLLQTIK